MTKTEQKTTAEAKREDIDARVQVEKERILAGWDRSEQQDRETRADLLAQRLVFAQLENEQVADIPHWEKRLAPHGCRPVLAAWPTIPVPRSSAGAYAPTDRMTQLKNPRPVVYNAGFYRLDERGIHLRQSGYWVASPVFQITRGIDDTKPDLYAVEVDGKWKTVPADPRLSAGDTAAIPNALIAAGLRLNPKPVHLDGNLNAVAHTRNQDHYTFDAWERLNAFFADHVRELPIRS